MGTQPNYRRKTTWIVLIVSAVVAVGWFQIAGYQTFRNLSDVWREEAELEAQVEALKARNAELESEIDDLAPGGPGIERRAREDLGWSKQDEVIIRIPDKE